MSMGRTKPILRHAASSPAPKIINTTRPSLTLKQRQVPGLGLGLGF
jgi:hypothetical protein